jgi:hypothetical protein
MNAESRASYVAHQPSTVDNDAASRRDGTRNVAPPAAYRPPAPPPPWTGLQRSPLARSHTIALVSLLSVGAVALGVMGRSLYDEYAASDDHSRYVAALAHSRAAPPDSVTPAPSLATRGQSGASATPSLFGPEFIKGPSAALAAARHPTTDPHIAGSTLLSQEPAFSGARSPVQTGDGTQVGQPPSLSPGLASAPALDTTRQQLADAPDGARDTAAPVSVTHQPSTEPRLPKAGTARHTTGRERRAPAIHEARATRDTRNQQARFDPLIGLRRLLRAAWRHDPPQRNRLDRGPQYKGQ